MIKKFTYPLPDELYVEGISGNIVAEYTYDGPETFDVEISPNGFVVDVDIQRDPELGSNFRKTINASTNTAVAYYLGHYFVDDYEYEYQYEDEILENGDVYKKALNPNLGDAYELRYDFEENDWKFDQIIKQQDNPSTLEAQRRLEYITKYSDKYEFSDEVEAAIEKYISDLNTFITNNPPLKSWKYINFDFKSVPKMPSIIAIEFAKLPSEGV